MKNNIFQKNWCSISESFFHYYILLTPTMGHLQKPVFRQISLRAWTRKTLHLRPHAAVHETAWFLSLETRWMHSWICWWNSWVFLPVTHKWLLQQCWSSPLRIPQLFHTIVQGFAFHFPLWLFCYWKSCAKSERANKRSSCPDRFRRFRFRWVYWTKEAIRIIRKIRNP